MSIIAVASGIYCSGEEIAQRVADRLAYALVGEELIDTAAQKFGTAADKLARAMTGDRSLFNVVTHEHEKSIVFLKAALAELLARDSLVYHGPATYLIPPAISHVLRVGVVAEQGYRIRQAAERDGLDPKTAEDVIHRRDAELAAWTRQQQARQPWDRVLFDLKIPLPSTSVTAAIDLICDSIAKDALMPTERSVQATLDFLLATQVNLALLDRGYHHCNVKANAGHVTIEITRKAAPPGALGRTMDALRLENLEDEARELCKRIDGIQAVEVMPARRGAKTLLVDDEQEFVMTLSDRLEMRDIDSEVVFNGEQALDFVDSDEPEVMVLDLRMPGIDGIEVLRRVKRDHPNVEVIVVTGQGTDEDERTVRELGAFDYLLKPVDIKTLAGKINTASLKARRRLKKNQAGQDAGSDRASVPEAGED